MTDPNTSTSSNAQRQDTPTTASRLYLVRIVSWSEHSRWIAASSREDALLSAEEAFLTAGPRHFTMKDRGIDFLDVEDEIVMAGSA